MDLCTFSVVSVGGKKGLAGPTFDSFTSCIVGSSSTTYCLTTPTTLDRSSAPRMFNQCQSGRISVSVIIGGLRVPLRVSLVLNRHHAAGQGAATTPVASKPEGVTAGIVVVVGVLEEETLRAWVGGSQLF